MEGGIDDNKGGEETLDDGNGKGNSLMIGYVD